MRTRKVGTLIAGLALGLAAITVVSSSAMADPTGDATKKPADQAKTPPPAATEAPANPKAIPVPSNLPVVKTTELEGGLVAEDLKIGDGFEVTPDSWVVANYHGTLKSDGTVFDSSFDRGEAVDFPLSGVIPGWQKGVPGMKVGGIRRLIIPAKLAYGDKSPSPKIPPNSDLVFVIQMVDALKIEDVKVGDGEEVGQQAVVIAAYSIKGADGKVVDSATKEKPYIWIPGEHKGISHGLIGMKVGGTRKLTVPALLNVSNPNLPSARPSEVPVTVEIEVLGVRNLVPPSQGKH